MMWSEKTFLWGAATSGHQVDGDNRNSDWWAWEQAGQVEGGVRSGRAADHRRLFREDLRLARGLGLNAYRFSFEWARFEPEEGKWDSAAGDWYEEMLGECEILGLLPMATLQHFTVPRWLAEQGGFSGENAARKFRAFVERVVRQFGARIPLWCTVNEPLVLIAGSYLGRFMPPGEYAPEAASLACHNLLRSHVMAYDEIRGGIGKRIGPFRDYPLMVGFAHNMLDFQAERPFHPLEILIAKQLHRLYNDAWLRAVVGRRQAFGMPWIFPYAPEVKSARQRRTADFIGVNYYTKALVHWQPRTASVERVSEIPISVGFARRKELASDLGWAVHPQGLQRILKHVGRCQLPIFITENGIADRADQMRPGYLVSHLQEVARAQACGVDIRGYFHWSLLDNFEWIKGFWPRFGLFSVDYDTFARRPTRTSRLLKEIIEAHGGANVLDPILLERFATLLPSK